MDILLEPIPQNQQFCSLYVTIYLTAIFSAKSLQGKINGLWSAAYENTPSSVHLILQKDFNKLCLGHMPRLMHLSQTPAG